MIDWIVKCFNAIMDFLMGEIKDPPKEEKPSVEERKKSHEQFWVHDQEKREFVNPENGVRASEKFGKTEKVSDRVKKVDNTRSPRTVNINRSGIIRSGDADFHVNTHDFIEDIIPTVTHFHQPDSYWSEPDRSSASSYESSSSDSGSSSNYDSFGGGSSDGGGSSSDW